MEAFAMNTPTLYLDCVILASTAYPSGLSYSLFSAWKRAQDAPRTVSTGLLVLLALPYLAITAALWFLRPGLFSVHGSQPLMFAIAVLLAPLALMIEYAIQAVATWRRSGQFARRIVVQNPWPSRLSLAQHLLLLLVAVGEEIFYRMVWLGALLSLGLPPTLAVGISSLAYGLNHLWFGGIPVLSKTVTGCLYGSLYLLGGQSIWLPIVTHVLQNAALFQVAWRTPRDA
jgi:membrane protease YdiL (CAAX protease family)